MRNVKTVINDKDKSTGVCSTNKEVVIGEYDRQMEIWSVFNGVHRQSLKKKVGGCKLIFKLLHFSAIHCIYLFIFLLCLMMKPTCFFGKGTLV